MVLKRDSNGRMQPTWFSAGGLALITLLFGILGTTYTVGKEVTEDIGQLNTTVTVNSKAIENNHQQIDKLVELITKVVEQNQQLIAYLEARK